MNPASIAVSSFQGQLDPLAAALTLFAGYFLVVTNNNVYKSIVVALCFGGAVALKSYPILLFPIFFFYISDKYKFRLLFTTIFGSFIILCLLPYLLHHPFNNLILISKTIIKHGSAGPPGSHLGLGSLFNLLAWNQESIVHFSSLIIGLFAFFLPHFFSFKKKENVFALIGLVFTFCHSVLC